MHLRRLWQSLIGSAKNTSLIEKLALIFVLVYYLFYASIPVRKPFYTVFPIDTIDRLSLCLLESPQKVNEQYFLLRAQVLEVGMQRQNLTFSHEGEGRLEALVPATLVESLYPGRLFSSTGSKAVFESGSILDCSGSFMKKNMNTKKTSLPTFFIKRAEQRGWKSGLSQFRALLRLAFKRLLYTWGEGGSLVLALLSGERLYLEPRLADAFRNAGLSHILALSGMHLSFFAGLTAGFASRIFGKKRAPFFSFLAISFFVWFAGFSPSLMRAYICAIIGLLSSFASLDINLTSVLSISFILQILIAPDDGMSLSFLLSYSALLGIALFSRFFFSKCIRFFPEPIALSLSASLAAQIFTIPLTLAFFGTITPIGIIATVFISPLISLFMSLSITAIILALCLPQTLFFSGVLIQGLYSFIAFLVVLFAKVPAIQL